MKCLSHRVEKLIKENIGRDPENGCEKKDSKTGHKLFYHASVPPDFYQNVAEGVEMDLGGEVQHGHSIIPVSLTELGEDPQEFAISAVLGILPNSEDYDRFRNDCFRPMLSQESIATKMGYHIPKKRK